MKNISILLLVFLTGCGEVELVNTCSKTIAASTFTDTETHEIKFFENKIESVTITHDYVDSDKLVIESIKLSLNSEDDYLLDNRNYLVDSDLQFKFNYVINKDSDENLKKHYNYTNDRYDYIKELEQNGFICK